MAGLETIPSLMAASVEGHNQKVQILPDRGANINAPGGFCGSALQAASAEGHCSASPAR